MIELLLLLRLFLVVSSSDVWMFGPSLLLHY